MKLLDYMEGISGQLKSLGWAVKPIETLGGPFPGLNIEATRRGTTDQELTNTEIGVVLTTVAAAGGLACAPSQLGNSGSMWSVESAEKKILWIIQTTVCAEAELIQIMSHDHSFMMETDDEICREQAQILNAPV